MLSVSELLAIMGRFLLFSGFISAGKEALFLLREGGNQRSDVNNCHPSLVLGMTLVLVAVYIRAVYGRRRISHMPLAAGRGRVVCRVYLPT